MMNLWHTLRETLAARFHVLRGQKPWQTGYAAYKAQQIKFALDHRTFRTDTLAPGYGYQLDERIIEYPWLYSQLPRMSGKLLDAGSVLNYAYLLDREPIKSKQIYISTLAPEAQCHWRRGVSYVFEDLRDTCYRDGFFDWVVCISTLEHIGLDNTILYTKDQSKRENDPDAYTDAIKEYWRILKHGGVLYLTVPFGSRYNHGWYQIFDGPMVDRVIDAFQPNSVEEFYFSYDQSGWHPSSRKATQEITCYDPDFAAFSRSIVCLKCVK